MDVVFPAPRLPVGHVLMGYDESGHCPMLIDGACSIYEHRPRTCRTYDCRVFAASGLMLDDPTKSAINDQVRRCQFQLADNIDRAELEAVRSAALLLRALEPGSNTTEQSLAAIEIHDQFLATDPGGEGCTAVTPNPESVRGNSGGGGRPNPLPRSCRVSGAHSGPSIVGCVLSRSPNRPFPKRQVTPVAVAGAVNARHPALFRRSNKLWFSAA